MIHPCITTHAWRLIGTREDLKEGNHSLLVGTAIRGCRASSGNDVPAVTRRLRVAAWRVRHRRSGERRHFSLGTRGKEHVLRLRDAIAGVGNVVTVLAKQSKPQHMSQIRNSDVGIATNEPPCACSQEPSAHNLYPARTILVNSMSTGSMGFNSHEGCEHFGGAWTTPTHPRRCWPT